MSLGRNLVVGVEGGVDWVDRMGVEIGVGMGFDWGVVGFVESRG